MDSNKKIILITGASSGMGKEAALHLIAEGHTVYGAARRVDKMQNLVDKGGYALALDVTDTDAVKSVVAKIIEEQGRIDILINNAGYAIYGAVEDISLEDARRQFEVNLFGVAALTKEVLPGMREQKSGTIINITSMGGELDSPLGAWYNATKHALEGWSDCLRLEVAQFGIDVVIVEPGAINTEFGDVMTGPMLERSKGSAYEPLAQAVAGMTKEMYENGGGSPPSVIAKTISKAIAAKRPKTRCAAGKFAKSMIWMRVRLGDRLFDKFVMSRVKKIAKGAG